MAAPDGPLEVDLIGDPTAFGDPALWLPAAVALVVVLLGAAAQWWLQRGRLKREDERARREWDALDQRWRSEVSEARRQYLNDQRRTLYVAFLKDLRAAERAGSYLSTALQLGSLGGRRDSAVSGIHRAVDLLDSSVEDLRLIASEAICEAAITAFVTLTEALDVLAYLSADGSDAWRDWEAARERIDGARAEVVALIRIELLGP